MYKILKFYDKQKFVWFCYLVVSIGNLFLQTTFFLPVFVVRNSAVQYR